jgi:ABC-type polysaccharide/polyol phosphate export permease
MMESNKTTIAAERVDKLSAEMGFAPFHDEISNDSVDISALPSKESFFSYVWRTVGELRYVKFALASFVVNNLRRRYQRSVLGFAWSLLNPLLMMIVLTTVFSLIFKKDPKTYGIFIFTGMLPWTFISESIAAGCSSITSAENFMKKVYIPKIFFPLVTVSTEVINFALSLVSMMALALLVGLQLHWTIILLPVAMAITYFFTFGISLALGVSTVYFRDIAHFVRVILACFFYLIPIVYPLSAVPEKYVGFFQANPFSHFINLYRQIIYYGNAPTFQEWLNPIMLALGSLMVGFFILRQKEKDIIFRL